MPRLWRTDVRTNGKWKIVQCSGTPETAKVQRSSQTQGGVQSKGTFVLRAGFDQERGGRTNPSPCCCSLPSSWGARGCTNLFTTIIIGGKRSIFATIIIIITLIFEHEPKRELKIKYDQNWRMCFWEGCPIPEPILANKEQYSARRDILDPKPTLF